jgi:hypothetical protein
MKYNRECTCTFYQLKQRGFKPVNHHPSCPMYNREVSKYKEIWINEDDKERYNEVNEKKKQKATSNSQKQS